MDRDMEVAERLFFMLPLSHTEGPDLPERAEWIVHHAEEQVELAPAHLKPMYEFSLGQARGHRDVIARFGRHPHRNAVLVRTSTPEELEYLKNEARPIRAGLDVSINDKPMEVLFVEKVDQTGIGVMLLRVAWLVILLGFAMEVLLLVLTTGFGDFLGLKSFIAGAVKSISWSVIVCAGLAIGTTVSRAQVPVMGVLGFSLPPSTWGTVIAHQSFALHFLYAHLRSTSRASRFATKYMEILYSLKRGGRFFYAPGLPFIEQHLPNSRFRVYIRRIPLAGVSTTSELSGIYGAAGIHAATVERVA
jgi:hypothetical protein